jgi:glycosyltransferase involved in cell wall biosynthesis
VQPEPFGRVVIEGMAAGKPVAAMNEGGPPEIVTDGTDGLLVAPRNAEAMRSALRRLRDEQGLARALGAEARVTVRRRFGPEASAARFLDALPPTLRPPA